MFSHVAPFSCLHCAVTRFVVWTQGVVAMGVGEPAPMVPGNGVVGASGINVPTPPFCWNRAGFTHSTSEPAGAGAPNSALFGRPKNEFSGGSFRNDEYAITHPMSVAAVQAGTFWNVPPTPLPSGTSTWPPSRIAETILLRTAALLSIALEIRASSIAEPWEWPISTKPRPLLNLGRYSWKAANTPSNAVTSSCCVTPPGVLIAFSVSCLYIGAYTRQFCENREAWS